MSLHKYYPYDFINYNTFQTTNGNSNSFCFENNCPDNEYIFPYWKYKDWYTNQQIRNYQNGLDKYITSRQFLRTDNLNSNPVFNSNMKPVQNNFMYYGMYR
jgi:hypothetical protein